MPKRQNKKRKVVEQLPDAATSESEAEMHSDDDRVYDATDRWHRQQDRLILRDHTDTASVSSGEERVPIPAYDEVYGLSDEDDEDDAEEEYEALKEAHDRFARQHRDELKRKDVRRDVIDEDSESEVSGKRSFSKKSEMAKAANWGKRRDAYYEADFDKRKDAFRFRTEGHASSGSDEDEELDEAQLEEREARAIQKRLAEPIDAQADALVGLGLAASRREPKERAPRDDSQLQTVTVDLEGMSVDEQLRLLKREAPELGSLVKEARRGLEELRGNWWPLLRARSNMSAFGAEFIRCKCELLLSYVLNLTFYLMLKARRAANVQTHPVIARVVELRTLLKQSDALDTLHAPTLEKLFECARAGQPALLHKSASKSQPKKKRARPTHVEETEQVEAISPSKHVHFADEQLPKKAATTKAAKAASELAKSQTVKRVEVAKKPAEAAFPGEPDSQTSEKRKISREMETNRGLTPKRAKHYRNPRVRHRVQFKRAIVRRRGQVRTARNEASPYSGELSGINMAVRKSTRLA